MDPITATDICNLLEATWEWRGSRSGLQDDLASESKALGRPEDTQRNDELFEATHDDEESILE